MLVEIAAMRMRHLFDLETNDLLGANTIALTAINQKCCQDFCTCKISASIRRFAFHRDIPEFEQAPAECRQFHPDGMLHSIW
ncbi:MAG: hypothetical protein R3D34_13305 [Nitratireductor sp.]